MEKLIFTLILLIISSFWYCVTAQTFMNARINTTDTTYEWFITNTNKFTMKAKDSMYVKWKANTFQLLKFDSTKNDGTPTRIAWLDNKGRFKISPIGSFTAGLITAGAITSALGGTPVLPTGTSSQYIKGDGSFTTFPINVSSFANDVGYITSNNVYSAGFGLTKSGSEPNATFSVNTTQMMTINMASDSILAIRNIIGTRLDTSKFHYSLLPGKPDLSIYYLNSNPSNYITASSSSNLTNKTGNISMWTNNSGYLVSSDLTPYATLSAVSSSFSTKLNSNDTLGLRHDLNNKLYSSNFTWTNISGKPSFATVATSGAYGDLSGKPSIPAAQVNSDWNSSSGLSQILNKPTLFSGVYSDLTGKPSLAIVATSGSYTDLTNKPSIPSAQVTQTMIAGVNMSVTTGANTFTFTNTAPDQNVTITAGTSMSVTSAYPAFTVAAQTRTFNSNPARALSTTGTNNTFVISSTNDTRVNYTINFSVSLVLTTSNGVVSLDYSIDGGANWISVSSVSQAYLVSITLTTNGDTNLSGEIPAGARVRIYRSTATNCTVALTKQQEVTY